jgi:hypothetical protein
MTISHILASLALLGIGYLAGYCRGLYIGHRLGRAAEAESREAL